MTFIKILSILFIANTLFAQPIIKKIDFRGLENTNKNYLLNFLKVEEGKILDTNQVRDEEKFLRNTQYFSEVSYEIIKEGTDSVNIIFHVKEKRTLLPIVNFNFIQNNFLLRLGAIDYNLFGTWNVLGGYYQRYDRNSYQVFWRSLNLFGSRIGFSSRYLKNATIEPAYFNPGVTFYNVDKSSIELAVSYDLSKYIMRNPMISVRLGIDFLNETYTKNFERSGFDSPGVDLDKRNKIIFKAGFTYADVDYYFELLEGIINKTYYDLVFEKNNEMGFNQVVNEFKWYEKFWNKINLAARLRLGISTNRNSPFIPFVIDNYVNVRGAGERVARGSTEVSLNFEARASIFRNDWTALQLVGFYDFSTLRTGGESLEVMFTNNNTYATTGLGVRVHLFNFYNVIFRFDYGAYVTDFSKGGFIIGLGQFF